MRQQRVISRIYEQADKQAGNIYGTRKARSPNSKAHDVVVYKPVVVQMGGISITGLKSVKVIKSPRRKPLDKEQRAWYACLSK